MASLSPTPHGQSFGTILGIVKSVRTNIALGPVGDDFLEVIPRALREDYAELLRGHRSCTLAMKSSSP
jgi:hypothetical protein